MESNYKDLALAIVKQAANDYEQYLVDDYNHSTEETRANLREVERFFEDGDVMKYISIDGVELMGAIKKQVIEYNYDLEALNKARRRDQ